MINHDDVRVELYEAGIFTDQDFKGCPTDKEGRFFWLLDRVARMFATNDKISITQIEGNWPQAAFPKKEMREEFVKDWPQLPDEKFKKYFVDWEPRGENAIPHYPTPQMASEIVDWMEMIHNIDDALGILCRHGVILPETALPCAQLSQTDFICHRNGCG